jgi:hypothetical protein
VDIDASVYSTLTDEELSAHAGRLREKAATDWNPRLQAHLDAIKVEEERRAAVDPYAPPLRAAPRANSSGGGATLDSLRRSGATLDSLRSSGEKLSPAPWYLHTGLVTLIYVLFWPLGLAFVWAKPDMKRESKVGATLFALTLSTFFVVYKVYLQPDRSTQVQNVFSNISNGLGDPNTGP